MLVVGIVLVLLAGAGLVFAESVSANGYTVTSVSCSDVNSEVATFSGLFEADVCFSVDNANVGDKKLDVTVGLESSSYRAELSDFKTLTVSSKTCTSGICTSGSSDSLKLEGESSTGVYYTSTKGNVTLPSRSKQFFRVRLKKDKLSLDDRLKFNITIDDGVKKTVLDPWWSSGYTYKRNLTVLNSSNVSLTNYTVTVSLNTTNFNYSHIQSDCDDIRFVDDVETTELGYERLNCNTSGTSIFMVKVQSLAANTNTSIWMYYGSSTVGTTSNKSQAYLYYNDFTTEPLPYYTGTSNTSYRFIMPISLNMSESGFKASYDLTYEWFQSPDPCAAHSSTARGFSNNLTTSDRVGDKFSTAFTGTCFSSALAGFSRYGGNVVSNSSNSALTGPMGKPILVDTYYYNLTTINQTFTWKSNSSEIFNSFGQVLSRPVLNSFGDFVLEGSRATFTPIYGYHYGWNATDGLFRGVVAYSAASYSGAHIYVYDNLTIRNYVSPEPVVSIASYEYSVPLVNTYAPTAVDYGTNRSLTVNVTDSSGNPINAVNFTLVRPVGTLAIDNVNGTNYATDLWNSTTHYFLNGTYITWANATGSSFNASQNWTVIVSNWNATLSPTSAIKSVQQGLNVTVNVTFTPLSSVNLTYNVTTNHNAGNFSVAILNNRSNASSVSPLVCQFVISALPGATNMTHYFNATFVRDDSQADVWRFPFTVTVDTSVGAPVFINETLINSTVNLTTIDSFALPNITLNATGNWNLTNCSLSMVPSGSNPDVSSYMSWNESAFNLSVGVLRSFSGTALVSSSANSAGYFSVSCSNVSPSGGSSVVNALLSTLYWNVSTATGRFSFINESLLTSTKSVTTAESIVLPQVRVNNTGNWNMTNCSIRLVPDTGYTNIDSNVTWNISGFNLSIGAPVNVSGTALITVAGTYQGKFQAFCLNGTHAGGSVTTNASSSLYDWTVTTASTPSTPSTGGGGGSTITKKDCAFEFRPSPLDFTLFNRDRNLVIKNNEATAETLTITVEDSLKEFTRLTSFGTIDPSQEKTLGISILPVGDVLFQENGSTGKLFVESENCNKEEVVLRFLTASSTSTIFSNIFSKTIGGGLGEWLDAPLGSFPPAKGLLFVIISFFAVTVPLLFIPSSKKTVFFIAYGIGIVLTVLLPVVIYFGVIA